MRDFMITLLACSVTMSVLALLYMAITPFLARRYSVKWRYYVWLVIVVGLIVPFRPQSDHAIMKVNLPAETVIQNVPAGNSIDVPAGSSIDVPAGSSIDVPAGRSSDVPAGRSGYVPAGSSIDVPTGISVSAESTSFLPMFSWRHAAVIIWISGIIVFLGFHAVRYYRFIKMAGRWSSDVTDERLVAILQELKTEMGISKQIRFHVCSCIGSPMIAGLIRPYILVPHTDFEREELYFILRHELVHWKRKDLYYKALMLAATALHWFNPIVYLMARAIDILCELSCDAETLQGTNTDTRLHYSKTIINVIKYQSKLKTALSTYFYGGKKGMKNRILSIMDTSKRKAGFAILCGALILTFGTGYAVSFDTIYESQEENVTADSDLVFLTYCGGAVSDSEGTLKNDPEYVRNATKALQATFKSVLEMKGLDYYDLDVSIDKNTGLMMYEGQPVREIWDSTAGIVILEFLGSGFASRDIPGAVDLTVVYQDGSPVGVHVSTQEEYDRRTRERLHSVSCQFNEEDSDVETANEDQVFSAAATVWEFDADTNTSQRQTHMVRW